MSPDPVLGIFLHAMGGIGAASFYIPFMRVRNWAWETYWLVGGVFIWIVCPWIVAIKTAPDLWEVLRAAPPQALMTTMLLGAGWGIGNLTFGLSLRYLGLSLGFAISLGLCTAFGAVMPPLIGGQLASLPSDPSLQWTMAGVAVCLAGIALCGRAGISKERELPDEVKRQSIREFNFPLGLLVALVAGIASSCINFAITDQEPIARLVMAHGVEKTWKNGLTFAIFLTSGGLTNILWCLLLNVRNGTLKNYTRADGASLSANYLLCLLAGLIAYSEFFFYGLAEPQMGPYSFTNLPIHLAFIIVFSNFWGFVFAEWKGTSRRTRELIGAGLAVLMVSTAVMGYGNYLSTPPQTSPGASSAAIGPAP